MINEPTILLEFIGVSDKRRVVRTYVEKHKHVAANLPNNQPKLIMSPWKLSFCRYPPPFSDFRHSQMLGSLGSLYLMGKTMVKPHKLMPPSYVLWFISHSNYFDRSIHMSIHMSHVYTCLYHKPKSCSFTITNLSCELDLGHHAFLGFLASWFTSWRRTTPSDMGPWSTSPKKGSYEYIIYIYHIYITL